MTSRRPIAAAARPPERPTSRALSRPFRSGGDAGRAQIMTRRYDIRALSQTGDIEEFSRVAPATPAFEDAFAALARGTLIATADGPVAVEDLMPGTMVETVTTGPQALLWVGAMTVYPEGGHPSGGEGGGLTRLAADAFGLGRPAPDLVLGPRARLLFRSPACRNLVGTGEAFAPARAFIDGDGAIPLAPVSPVRVFHLCFHGQQVVRANGMEVESFHPGAEPQAMMTPDSLDLFLSLFPHLDVTTGFGPLQVPRLTAFELERLRAA